MKFRRGFVTNSSSTNFGTMLVTSLGGIGLASVLSSLEDGERGDGGDGGNKDLIVRLVIATPEENIFKPGEIYKIRAQIKVLIESEGEFKTDNEATSSITFDCTSENEVCQFLDPIDEDNGAQIISKMQGIFVKDDEELLNSLKYGGWVNIVVTGSYQGKGMSRQLNFKVPVFNIKLDKGVFLVETGMQQEFDLIVNTNNCSFEYDFESSRMLKSEDSVVNSENRIEHIKLTECIEDETEFFKPSVSSIKKEFEVKAITGFGELKRKYTAKFVREAIIIPPPNQFKVPFIIECLPDDKKEEREKQAIILPIKVMKYNEDKKDLEVDFDLSNSLNFDVTISPNYNEIENAEAQKIIDNAKIIFELRPEDGNAMDGRDIALYRIYASALSEALVSGIDLKITITCTEETIKEVVLDAVLKPKVSVKGLIKEFIQVPYGYVIGDYVDLGDVDKFWSAIDYTNIVIDPKAPTPGYQAPPTNKLYLLVQPPSEFDFYNNEIFSNVQTIYHELVHSIESQNWDNMAKAIPYAFYDHTGNKETNTAMDERHSDHCQYLSQVVRAFVEMEEKAKSSPIPIKSMNAMIEGRTSAYYDVFFNPSNLIYPINREEIRKWFGVSSSSQHKIFSVYRDFGSHNKNANYSQEQIDSIENGVANYYFPGDINGEWIDTSAVFSGVVWNISWKKGYLEDIKISDDVYTLVVKERNWAGMKTLNLTIKVEVTRKKDGKKSHLEVELDAGTYDIDDYNYPAVEKFNLKWKSNNLIGNEFLGGQSEDAGELSRK